MGTQGTNVGGDQWFTKLTPDGQMGLPPMALPLGTITRKDVVGYDAVFSDEFDDGSPDARVRGWTITDLAGNPCTWRGPIDPLANISGSALTDYFASIVDGCWCISGRGAYQLVKLVSSGDYEYTWRFTASGYNAGIMQGTCQGYLYAASGATTQAGVTYASGWLTQLCSQGAGGANFSGANTSISQTFRGDTVVARRYESGGGQPTPIWIYEGESGRVVDQFSALNQGNSPIIKAGIVIAPGYIGTQFPQYFSVDFIRRRTLP